MASGPRSRDAGTTLLRDRLLDAAADILAGPGWRDVTMAELGRRGGVSRQTVYNEVGAKSDLAQALVLRELERFLTVVVAELQGHDDVVDGLQAAALGALRAGHDNALLKAILSSAHGGGDELLPLLTTHSEALLERATTVVRQVVVQRHGDLGLPPDRLDLALDTMVRLVLSHVMQPSGAAERTAKGLGWVAARLFSS